MLKRSITYEDFNGENVTEVFYFNLTKTELLELEVGYDGGLEATIKRIISAENTKELIAEFKRIILLAYGKKSDDGKRFLKSDAIREEFSQTAAYDALFMELATDDDAAAAFVNGIMPRNLGAEVAKEMKTTPPIPVPPGPSEG